MATKQKRAKKSAKQAPKKNGAAASDGISRVRWDAQQDKALKTLIKQNTPTRVIGLKLERTEAAVRQRVSKLGLSLRPTNRSPYG